MVDPHDRMPRARRGALAAGSLALVAALSFAAPALAGPSPVLLRTAGGFATLAGSGLDNTGTTTIVGDVGSTPTPSQAGFTPCPGAANCVSLTGTNHIVSDGVSQQAQTDLRRAFDDAAGRTGGAAVVAPLGGGQTLPAGLYTAATSMFVGGDLTLDGGGDADAVFIFQAGTTLITAASTAPGIPNTRVLLTNGAQACNVFWQVGSSATIEADTQFVGNILAGLDTTLVRGATLDAGRTLSLDGALTMDSNVVKKATCDDDEDDGDTSSDDDTTTEAVAPAAPVAAPTTPIPAPALVTAPTLPVALAGTARISAPTGPVSGPFAVTVTGRAIARVVFYVDGRRAGTVVAKRGRKRFSLRVDPRRQSRRVHRVTATVTFDPGTPTRITTRRTTYRRPSAPRGPRFTG